MSWTGEEKVLHFLDVGLWLLVVEFILKSCSAFEGLGVDLGRSVSEEGCQFSELGFGLF